MESFVQANIIFLPANDAKLQEYRQGQVEDDICSQIIQWCQSEWSNRGSVSSDLQCYWTIRTELSYVNGLLLLRNRIVIPKSLQRMTLQKIHQGRQGISKCYGSFDCSLVARSLQRPGSLCQDLPTVLSDNPTDQ
uniref:Uncharacterized protein n=1 Tax=Amphimedon queenslandica TaxID=400682 RepID=A0A1X7U8Z4_AMPQE